jgi:hypothetical protein
MTTLTAAECFSWIASHISTSSLERVPSPITGKRLTIPNPKYKYPPDSGKKVALARKIYKNFEESTSVLIWVRNWSIFPSSGHLPLLIQLRSALDERSSLDERPGHLLQYQQADQSLSLIILCLEFYWDCIICGSDSKIICELSHDEFYTFYGDNIEKLSEIETALASGKWGNKIT